MHHNGIILLIFLLYYIEREKRDKERKEKHFSFHRSMMMGANDYLQIQKKYVLIPKKKKKVTSMHNKIFTFDYRPTTNECDRMNE